MSKKYKVVIFINTPMNEQETIIRWYRDEKTASVYTSDIVMMNKYDKYVDSGDWFLVGTEYFQGDIISKTYTAPKELVFGRCKKKRISDETKKQITDNLTIARNKKSRINSTLNYSE